MHPSVQKWTNSSVRSFACEVDPIARMLEVAGQTALDAMDHGWKGPPFDPFGLADYLGLQVLPNENIRDARTLQHSGKFVIEYNPTRPRQRIKFSVAHEIAHTFFQDCGARIRYREPHADKSTDSWQLELLCNIGASELLMPAGSLAAPDLQSLSIDKVCSIREKFQVSTEAVVLRLVRLAEMPCAAFAASKTDPRGLTGTYRIDYMLPSRTWTWKTPHRLVAQDSAIQECTAIGYTSKRTGRWSELGINFRMECVGVPAYPNQVLPRVVGLLMAMTRPPEVAPTITYWKGDATDPRGAGNRILAHIVNDKALLWGAGFGLALRKQWPEAQEEFRAWALKNRDSFRLGEVKFTEVGDFTICHMVAQHGYGFSDIPRVRYKALAQCLQKLSAQAQSLKAEVHMPRIGCGEAGGTWKIICDLIEEYLCRKGINVFVYDLPGTKEKKASPQGLLFGEETELKERLA